MPNLSVQRINGRSADIAAAPQTQFVLSSGQTEMVAAILWRRRWTIALVLLAALAGTGAYLKLATPTYLSTARLVVDSRVSALPDNVAASTMRPDTVQDTKARLLTSTPVLQNALASLTPDTLSTVPVQKDPVAWLRQRLRIETSRRDDFVSVSLASTNAHAAADLVNAVVTAFVAYDKSLAQSGPEKMVAILGRQQQDEENQLDRARTELIAFGNAHPNLASGPDGFHNVVVQKLDGLQHQSVDTQLALTKDHAELQQFKTAVAAPAGVVRFVDAQQLKGGEFFDKEYLQLQTDLAQLLLTQAVSGDDRDSRNPNARRITDAIAQLQERSAEKRRAMVAAWAEHLEQQVDADEKRRASLDTDIAAQRTLATELEADQIGLARRQAAVDRSQKAADRLAAQIKDTAALEAGSALNVHVVEDARVETEPSGPGMPQVLLIGCGVGVVAGCGLAMFRESTDRRFREPAQVVGALDLPIVGLIPQLARSTTRAMARTGGRTAGVPATSDAAEAYRSLYAMLAHGRSTADVKTLLITSAIAGDGKSSCASNLAIAYAEAGRRTLLVDCDWRRPVQHVLFGDTPHDDLRGITDVVAGHAKLADVVRETSVPNLGLLPCGTIPSNPHELLNNDRLDAVLRFARRNFDMVIIDSPPIVNVPDARVLAPKADGTVLVVRTNRSTDRQTLFARDELRGVGARVCGVVLNAVARRNGEFAYYGAYSSQDAVPMNVRVATVVS